MRTSLPIRIGHASDERLKSGTTVILPDLPARASVHVAGGAPGTRDTDLLAPENTVERIDAIVISGGSAFGLAAADGVTAWLAGRGRGLQVGHARVPLVPAAIIFDLLDGGDKTAIPGPHAPDDHSPYRELGHAAATAARPDFGLGSVGAGTGATTADLKGGFGAAASTLPGGATVAAFVVVNSVGRVTLGDGAHFRAAPFERDAEFGGLGLPVRLPADAGAVVTKPGLREAASTTVAVIATDLFLTKAELKRLAIAAHDGLALAIYPAHTPSDGDTVFAVSTGGRRLGDDRLGALTHACAAAAATLARAVAVGVFAATPAASDLLPTWGTRFGRQRDGERSNST